MREHIKEFVKLCISNFNTPEAFKSLLKRFETQFTGYVGEDDFPHTILGMGIKDKKTSLEQFEPKFQKWKAEKEIEFKNQITPIEQYTSRLKYWKSLGYRNSKAFIIWISPPFLLPIIQFLYNRKRFIKI